MEEKMDLIKGIKERRSIRSFKQEPISPAEVEKAVDAARFAPSWKNTQTVRYKLVLSREIIDRIAEEATMDFVFNANTLKYAPALIVLTTVSGISGYEQDGSASTPKGSHWESFDAGIAAEAFALAAHEAGLGTVIMGIFDEPKVAEIIGLPEGESISALLAIGHPAKDPAAPPRLEVDQLLTVIE